MGGGGESKDSTTTTKTELPAWLAQDYQKFIGQTDGVNEKPYQSYPGQLNAGPTQQQLNAMALAGVGADGGLQGQLGQTGALRNILGGGNNIQATQNPYAGSNSQLNAIINNTSNDITDQYNKSAALSIPTQFAQGGAFGGSAMQQANNDAQRGLAQELAQNATSLRYQDYNNQADRWQQGFQNQLAASQQNTQNVLGASQALNGVNALQSQFIGQYANLAQPLQDYNQGNIDQAYNDWYQKNYGYDQQKLSNYGNALNAVSGQFQGSSTTGANPAYKPKTAGGALASAGSGALAGASFGPWGAVAGGVIGAGMYYL